MSFSRRSTSCKTRSSTNSSSSGSIRRSCSTSPAIPGGSRPSNLTYHPVPETVLLLILVSTGLPYAVLDVVVDDEVQFFIGEAILLREVAVHSVHDGLL